MCFQKTECNYVIFDFRAGILWDARHALELRTHYPQRAQVQPNFVEERVSCCRVVVPAVAVLSSAAVVRTFEGVQQPGADRAFLP